MCADLHVGLIKAVEGAAHLRRRAHPLIDLEGITLDASEDCHVTHLLRHADRAGGADYNREAVCATEPFSSASNLRRAKKIPAGRDFDLQ